MNTGDQAVASNRNQLRWGSHRHTLLQAYLEFGEMTDEDAGIVTGLYDLRSAYWMRCSQLRKAGYIKDTGKTKIGLGGTPVMICRITTDGRKHLAKMNKDRIKKILS